MDTGKMIRVLVADDNKAVRDVLALFVGSEPDLDLVGVARDGQEAVALCEQLQPDVVLMDLLMPVMDGIDATIAIRAARIRTKVVMLTNTSPLGMFTADQKAQPDACMSKQESMQQVFDTVRALCETR